MAPTVARHVICKCPKLGSRISRVALQLGRFRYHSSSSEKHLSSCPLYLPKSNHQASRSLSFSARPFLAGTIELFSMISVGQQLASFSVRYYPTVSRRTSPAFGLLSSVFSQVVGEATYESLHAPVVKSRPELSYYYFPYNAPCTFKNVEQSILALPNSFKQLLQSDSASLIAKDGSGRTILVVSRPPNLSYLKLGNAYLDVRTFFTFVSAYLGPRCGLRSFSVLPTVSSALWLNLVWI